MIQFPGVGEQPCGETRVLFADAGGTISRTVTDAGTRVISEAMAGVRSVCVGVWAPVGSRDETQEVAGASHFLEHLLFKGTAKRSALEISAAIDAVGGDLNAFTTKEYTCFYARVLDRDLSLAVDVLVDMAFHSLVTAADLDAERNVILEEIAMHDDDPAGVAQELFAEQVFAGSPLARPIIGTVDSITGMSRDAVVDHYRAWYTPESLVITAAGGVEHEQLLAAIATAADGVESAADPPAGHAWLPRQRNQAAAATRPEAGTRRDRERDFEQTNIVVGYPALRRLDPRRFEFMVLNLAVGGGMSSRLFQEVRERRGLAYSVQSFATAYSDTGVFGIYAGATPAKADLTINVIDEVLDAVRGKGLTTDELERGKGQARGRMVLAAEESSTRMLTLGESELITGEYWPIADRLAGVDAVTLADVHAVAEDVLSGPQFLSVVGPKLVEVAL